MDKNLDIRNEEMAMYHHTQAEKQAAIDLCISSGRSPSAVERTLGYPDASTPSRWYRDYLRRGYAREPEKWPGKFAEEQKRAAVGRYLATGKNASKTVGTSAIPAERCSADG